MVENYPIGQDVRKKNALVPDHLLRYLQSEEGRAFQPSFVVDGDLLASKTDDEVWTVYRSCKAARAARIILFYELCRRGKVGGKTIDGVPALERYFREHGFEYDTEQKFVYRDKKAFELELEEARLAALPQPVPDLTTSPAGDGDATEREDIEDSDTMSESEPAEKKPCYRCGQHVTKIERLEKEKQKLKDEIEEWGKATQSRNPKSFLNKEAERVEKALKQAKKTAKAPVVNPSKSSGSMIGKTSEPVDGFYWEFVKDGMYAILDAQNPNLGILTKLKSPQDADLYISERVKERRAAAAAAKGATA